MLNPIHVALLSLVSLVSACGPSGASDPSAVSGSTPLTNFAGQTRYVKKDATGIRLYLSESARASDNPKAGFNNANTFSNSCAPDAAVNLFRWHGIETLAKNAGRPFTPQSLGVEMKTNTWEILWIDQRGTTSGHFNKVAKKWAKDFMPATHSFYYVKDVGAATARSTLIERLSHGDPVVAVFKMGDWGGHFALVIGLDYGPTAAAADDVVILANGKNRSWAEFEDAWRREYALGIDGIPLSGEEPFAHWFIKLGTAPSGGGGAGGGGGGHDGPPKHQN